MLKFQIHPISKIVGYLLLLGAGILLLHADFTQHLIAEISKWEVIRELFAGLLYTSLFTIPISVELLHGISETSNIYFIAIIGGIGATVGDFLLMKLVQKMRTSATPQRITKRVKKSKLQDFLMKFLGFACFMLPVPDEIAVTLLGLQRITPRIFFLIVYPAKTLGIFMVTTGASAIF